MDAPPLKLRCLVVSDGRRGIENQALGLAERLQGLMPLAIETLHLPRTGALPAPPEHVDLWIGCGRAAVRAARVHKQALPGACFVYVQDPRADHALFDLIVAPRHDRLAGPNVFNIIGSPNRITAERLTEGEAAFAERLATLPGPRAAILIGGDSKHHRFTDQTCAYLLDAVQRIRSQAGSVLITPSRRSPAAFRAALADRFGDDSAVWLHDGDGPNPYFAFLSAADWICVTEDSTNMLCEAASTGKPVYRLRVDGKPGKFRRLYAALEGEGAVRPFLGRLDVWTGAGLQETRRAAEAVLEILDRRAELRAVDNSTGALP
jgi:mitochondrial fission protein ELM1